MSGFQQAVKATLAPSSESAYPEVTSAADRMVQEIDAYIKRASGGGNKPRPIASDGINSFFLHQLASLGTQVVLAVGEDENGEQIDVICHYTALLVIPKFEPEASDN